MRERVRVEGRVEAGARSRSRAGCRVLAAGCAGRRELAAGWAGRRELAAGWAGRREALRSHLGSSIVSASANMEQTPREGAHTDEDARASSEDDMRVVVVDAQCVVVVRTSAAPRTPWHAQRHGSKPWSAWRQQTIYVRASGQRQQIIYVLNMPLDGGGTKRVEVVQQQGCDLAVHVDSSSADALDRWEFSAGTPDARSLFIGSPQQE